LCCKSVAVSGGASVLNIRNWIACS